MFCVVFSNLANLWKWLNQWFRRFFGKKWKQWIHRAWYHNL